jgi:hypothetical protein
MIAASNLIPTKRDRHSQKIDSPKMIVVFPFTSQKAIAD